MTERLERIARVAAMLEAGYSYGQIAAELGVTRSSVQRLEESYLRILQAQVQAAALADEVQATVKRERDRLAPRADSE